ncbi:MAG: fatty acid desaturase [Pseudomonadota bacterium]
MTTSPPSMAQITDEIVDHRRFLASLEPEARRALSTLSDRAGLGYLVPHLAAIGGLAALVAEGVAGWPLLLLPLGILQVFLFCPLHETTHRTAFRSPWLNSAVAHLAGLLLLIPPTWFRYFHFAHHRHTQDPAQDPELARPKPVSLGAYAWHVSGLPYWRSQITTLVRNAAGGCNAAFVPESARRRVQAEAVFMLAAYAGLVGGSLWLTTPFLLWIWIVPVVIGQPALRLYLLAEHGRCPPVANMFENTRTTFTSWLVRRLAWNMPFHAEHHSMPTVPFHRLADLHARVRPHLCQTERGYVAFQRRYLAGFARRSGSAP